MFNLLDNFSAQIEKLINSMSNGQNLGFDTIQKLQELINKAQGLLDRTLPASDPRIVDILTYDDAINFFVEKRPDDSHIEKGAIMRQTKDGRECIYLLFLNGKNEMVRMPNNRPYGQKIIASNIDEELLEAFGNKDLIIVE